MEADERAEDDESGKQKGPDGIDVDHGVERDAPLQPRRLVTQSRRHPGMRTLMKTERKKQQNKLEYGNEEGAGRQSYSPKL